MWAQGDAYEPYIGRWSRLVAREFVDWLDVLPGGRWLDVGCGTGALSATILAHCRPSSVKGIDASDAYVLTTSERISDPRAAFRQGDAQALPFGDAEFDAAVSGLMLNFLPDPSLGLAEMARVAKPNGIVALYVWDYAGEMQLMRSFWDAAAELNPAAAELDEGRLFPICQPDALRRMFDAAGLSEIEVRAIDIPTVFADFDDYWTPFLGGRGPAPAYAASLSDTRRIELRKRIRASLPTQPDGSISLIARAWAARGRRSSTSLDA